MQQHYFHSYSDYIHAQERLTLIKVNRPNYRCFTTPVTVRAILACHLQSTLMPPHPFGLCHGVRDGKELTMFREAFGGIWIGTEITESLCNGIDVVHQDFTHVPDDWVGIADVIYSNSLDHALDPYKTVRAWLACLNCSGRLYVEWTPWHARLGRHYKADCFAATDREYYALLNRVGSVLKVIEIEERGRRNYVRRIFQVY